MTAFDYSRLRGTADRLIARFGKPATLTRTTAPGDDWQEWDGPEPTSTATFPLTVVEDKTTVRYSRDPAGALIPRTVRVLMIAADGEAPRMGDVIALSDGPHAITRVAPLQPGAMLLLHEVEIAA